MKKAAVAMILACALLASCLAAFAEASDAGSDLTPEKAAFLDLLNATVDLSQYRQEGSSLYADYELDKAVMEAEVDGTTLKLGMSFDEVISAGFKAPEGFADEETHENISTSIDFLTPGGNKVDLGFTGKTGGKLADGTLDGISRGYWLKTNAADVTIAGISVGTDLATLVEVMGEPHMLSDDSDKLSMRYEFNDDVIMESVTFYVTFDGKVAGLGLGGTFKK